MGLREHRSSGAYRVPDKPLLDLTDVIRSKVDEVIEQVVEEELAARLGAGPYERTDDRVGYRNGTETRRITTPVGTRELKLPRARLFKDDGGTEEWRSKVVPRYQRRAAKVDEAILGCYLTGSNTRRIRRALRPLLGDEHLSKSAVSRVIQRLKVHFEEWSQRDLSNETYVYLYLDATMLPVRIGKRVTKVPVQAVLGVRDDGQKVVLSLDIVGRESTAAWKATVEDLARRGLKAPFLVIIDGNPGLSRAVRETWPGAKVQRCTKHKQDNLLAKAPKHLHRELVRDYRDIIDAEDEGEAKKRYHAFRLKWKSICAGVAKSLEEGGDELLTFMAFPRAQWKCLRTTNQIERLNGEFKRRTKTQGSFRNEGAALVLLYGLLAMGQIKLRKIDGWKQMGSAIAKLRAAG